jgi:hypothetical protein
VQQPPGYAVAGEEGKVYHHRKGSVRSAAGYACLERQAGRHTQGNGLLAKRSRGDNVLGGSGCSILLVSVYVDDLIITGAKEREVEAFKA